MTSQSVTVTPLTELAAGSVILVDGAYAVQVPESVARAFKPNDRLLTLRLPNRDTADLLHLPAADVDAARVAVSDAVRAFEQLQNASDDAITTFFQRAASLLEDDAFGVWDAIKVVNTADVAAAQAKGRTTTRLAVSDAMRAAMVEGLRTWARVGAGQCVRAHVIRSVDHGTWVCEAVSRELGVVGFVFESRPNVVVDAAGVLRYGNSVVMRIGADARATATAIIDLCIRPALREAGLPETAVALVPSASHAGGWALFSDPRLALAVARGSGHTVDVLGAIASAQGTSVSLHGMGGAWGIISDKCDESFLRTHVTSAIVDSLDRKVCNTLNTIVIVADRRFAADAIHRAVATILSALDAAAARLGVPTCKVHYTPTLAQWMPPDLLVKTAPVLRVTGARDELVAEKLDDDGPALLEEWEWEKTPEVSVAIAASVADAIALFNTHSPQFVLSMWSPDAADHSAALKLANAPFVGDGHSRWVDGQKALRQPELGLSNWQRGRLLGRAGILTGADMACVTLRHRSK